MSNSKRNISAAQQRSQRKRLQDKQRPQASNQKGTRGRRYQQKRRNPLLIWLGFAGGLLVLIIIFIIVALNLSTQNSQKATLSANDFHQITTLSPSLLNQVANGSADGAVTQTLKPVKNTPNLQGPNGRPEVFYMGGEFCPICGAQRWALIIALSRFGTFEKPLTPILSAEDNVPTFSFYEGSYTSNYVDFVPVETYANSAPPNYVALQKMTADQQKIVDTYDAPPYVDAKSSGAFPFISIGNQYVTTGSYFSPELLIGQSYDQIVAEMKDPTSDISRGMLGSANYLTAEICQITQNQPGSVCNSNGVSAATQKLPKASVYIDQPMQLTALNLSQPVWIRQKRS